MNIKKYPSSFWIGLAQVRAKNPMTLGAEKAYVNVVSVAKNRKHFRNKVRDAMTEMNCELKRLEDAEPLTDRIQKYKVDEQILKLADSLNETQEDVKFSTFHTYD